MFTQVYGGHFPNPKIWLNFIYYIKAIIKILFV